MTARTPKAPPLPRGDRNANPPGIRFWSLVAEDYRVHGREFFSQGFWTMFWHRFGNWRMSVRPKVLRMPLSLLYRCMFKCCEWFCGIKLSYNVKVGRRVRLEHFGGMILGARAIGSDVTLRQNTTLGVASKSDLNAKPILKDHVEVGAGAVIVGDIVIGRGAIIAANAVVTRSVPDYAVVGGVPARLIRMRDPSEISDIPSQNEEEASEPQKSLNLQMAPTAPRPKRGCRLTCDGPIRCLT